MSNSAPGLATHVEIPALMNCDARFGFQRSFFFLHIYVCLFLVAASLLNPWAAYAYQSNTHFTHHPFHSKIVSNHLYDSRSAITQTEHDHKQTHKAYTTRSVALFSLPRHVAYIVDGNGRWGEKNGANRLVGHKKGADNTVEIVKATFLKGIPFITLYLFSTENWSRPSEEVGHIMSLLNDYLLSFADYLRENKIELIVIGQAHRLPSLTQNLLSSIGYQPSPQPSTQEERRVLCLAISYGGRDDIIQACQEMSRRVVEQTINTSDITENTFSKLLSLGKNDIPDPDLIVRTSGEFRLSNFLLWNCAYSELAIVDCLWPDYSCEENDRILGSYSKRRRRYGGASAQ